MRLLKGFEIELFTGTSDGEAVGLSDKILSMLPDFHGEIDKRHVEYTTSPQYAYDILMQELLQKRARLRDCLDSLGLYTLIPGSVMAMGGYDSFNRLAPENPYHTHVEQQYGTKLVTASVHINIGIDNPEKLMQAFRLIRLEAPLYLALSAASPFIDGRATGYHSVRWHQYPQVPKQVPLFESHLDYIRWVERQLDLGTMNSVRQLWTSVRPNGDRRPYELNRLELRICDLITDPISLLAITALLEARLRQLLNNPQLDPLQLSQLPSRNRTGDLMAIAAANETAAAEHSLDAVLRHWQDGRQILARDWISSLYNEVMPIAQEGGFHHFLYPLQDILKRGNTAQQWLRLHSQGLTPRQILQGAIIEMAQREQRLSGKLYQPIMA